MQSLDDGMIPSPTNPGREGITEQHRPRSCRDTRRPLETMSVQNIATQEHRRPAGAT